MTNDKQRVLILSDSPLHRDPRVLVQLDALQDQYEVICCGITSPSGFEGEFIPIKTLPGVIGAASRFAFRQTIGLGLQALQQHNASYFLQPKHLDLLKRLRRLPNLALVLCNDVNMLPIASKLIQSSATKLYLDAHEYTPRQWDGDWRFKPLIMYWTALLKQYGPSVDLMTTVCERIAEEYRCEFNLPCNTIVYNAPEYDPTLAPSTLDTHKVRMVHHGGLNHNRKLENMIQLVKRLDDRFTLDFYLLNNAPRYMRFLRRRANDCSRIRFFNPVPMKDIARTINQYDLALLVLSPDSFNYRYCLPNKFFEAIQARLAIATWPSPEMAYLTSEHELGVVSKEYSIESIATALSDLQTRDLDRYKQNAHQVAEKYSAQASRTTVYNNVVELLNSGTP